MIYNYELTLLDTDGLHNAGSNPLGEGDTELMNHMMLNHMITSSEAGERRQHEDYFPCFILCSCQLGFEKASIE